MRKSNAPLGVLVKDSVIDYFLNYDNATFDTQDITQLKAIDRLCVKTYNCDVYRYRLLSFDDPIIKIKFISPIRTVEFICSVRNRQLAFNWHNMQHGWEYRLKKES